MLKAVQFFSILLIISKHQAFNLIDYTHYLDYLPIRQEGWIFEDFRTAANPPLPLRNRKMKVDALKGKDNS